MKIKVERIEYHQEDVIDIDFDAKGIRLDLYIKGDDKSYDIEVQVTDTKDLPKRARYYQGMMDIDFLKSGEKYSKLNENYVIFLCLDDIFKAGLPIYSFENICRENTQIKLEDKSYKIFFNAKDCDKLNSDEQKDFFRLLKGERGNSDYARNLEELVKEAKHNTQWRMQFMTWDRQRAYDYDAGKKEKAIESAKIMIRDNMSPELVSKYTSLPLEEILNLEKELKQPILV